MKKLNFFADQEAHIQEDSWQHVAGLHAALCGPWRGMAALTEGGFPAMQESGQRLTPEEVDRADMMHKYTLNNAHYFCETADVTRPFPSRHPVSSPSWEFVWNRWLAASLRSQGLAEHCPQLLQVSAALPLMHLAAPACMRLSAAW